MSVDLREYPDEVAELLAQKAKEIYGDDDPAKAREMLFAIWRLESVAEKEQYRWAKERRIQAGRELSSRILKPLRWKNFHTEANFMSRSADVPLSCEGKYGEALCSYFAKVEGAAYGIDHAFGFLNYNKGYYSSSEQLLKFSLGKNLRVELPKWFGSEDQYFLGSLTAEEIREKLGTAETAEQALNILEEIAADDWEQRREVADL